MVFSYRELGEWVDLSGIDPNDVIHRLTFSGFEVEESHPATQASKVVSGHILTCVPHPDSDHLHCLTVDCGGKYGTLGIVCGAPNARAGINVIVALPGCVLPALAETIQKGVIRGQESNGMCCSLVELGLDKGVLPAKETEGITELPADYPAGDEDVLAHLGFADTLIDINVLANRPDCLSYLGMAREIAALMGRPLKAVPQADFATLGSGISLAVKTPACAAFSFVTAELGNAVNAKEAQRIQHVLWLSGLTSVSPLVDLGNYAMLLTGQPFHIYDLDKAQTQALAVADDWEGDFKALDGKTYALKKGDIVVENGAGVPLCLAGILGGEASMDSDATRRIGVEAASFHHAAIRHTCARLGVSSASSQLFGKEVNPRGCEWAQGVFASELKKLYPESRLVSKDALKPGVTENVPFAFSSKALNHRLGTAYTEKEIQAVLDAYGLSQAGEGKLVAPWYRVDLNEQADVDEEVFRFYPADKVPLSYEGLPLTEGGLSETQRLTKAVKEFLLGRGLNEILTFTLIDKAQDKSIRVFYSGEPYVVKNPLTADHEVVRTDLLPSMVETLERNLSRKQDNLAFFEVSHIDTPKGNKDLLSIGFAGEEERQDLFGARPYDFFDLKAVADGILSLLGIANSRTRLARSQNPAFHPGKSADLFLGKTLVGTFGALNPGRFKHELLVGEFDLGALLAVKTGKIKFVPFGQHPTVRRDLSFEIHGEVPYRDVVEKAKKASKGLLKDVVLFDAFENPKTGAKSLGLALYLGAEDRTLTDKDTEGEVLAIAQALTAAFPLTLRKA